eukprot:TRINITY_DN1440_c2_g1_i1.p1 TRINITY_DN1440_c2_g1~~TRINITY_DN1440_c2_g1_i1.p1  ORF type:complete len:1575 (+),score=263.12 TRINITY_DN1440_c2_g1_i1:15-4739(+)
MGRGGTVFLFWSLLLLSSIVVTVNGSQRQFLSRCIDDNDAMFAASSQTMRCADVFAKNGETCSLHGPLVVSFVEGGILTIEKAAAMMELCPVTCKFCTSSQDCLNDDEQATTHSTKTCSEMVMANSGNCDTTGPFLSSLSPLKADLTVQACPRSCLICVPTCEEVTEVSELMVFDDTAESCGDLVQKNDGICSKEGTLLGGDGTKEQKLKATCPSSCRECAPLGTTCSDYDSQCNDMAAGTFCDPESEVWWGDMDVLKRQQLIFNCPLSCGRCVPSSSIPCFDDDSLFVGKLQTITNCDAVLDRNFGCDEGPLTRHADASLSNYGINGDQLKQLFQSQCRLTCGLCLPDAPVVEYASRLFLIHSNPSISGQYDTLINTTCNTTPRDQQLPVYSRTVPGNPLVTAPAFIFNDGEGRWVAATSLQCGIPARNISAIMRSTESQNYTAPQTLLKWSTFNSVLGSFNPDADARIQEQGCPGDAQCLLLNCQEPHSGFQCHECTIEFAELTCSSDSFNVTLLLFVVSLSLVFIVCGAHTVRTIRTTPRNSVPPATMRTKRDESFTFNKCILTYRATFVVKMAGLGRMIATHRPYFIGSVLLSLLSFSCMGIPTFELNSGGSYSSDWAPQGGRLEREIEYVKKWTEDSKRSHYIQILLGPTDTSKNALKREYALTLLSVLEDIVNITVPVTYTNDSGHVVSTRLGWEDFCTSIDHPALDAVIPGPLPCMNPSVLNCFYEGSWQLTDEAFDNLELAYRFSTQLPSANGTITSYKDRPSLRNMTDEEVIQRYSDTSNCDDWAKSTSLGRSEMFGGYVDDGIPRTPGGETTLVSAERIGATIMQYSAKRAREFKHSLRQVDERTVEEAMDNWFDAIHDKLHEIDEDEVSYPGISVAAFMSVSVDRMFDEIGKTRVKDLVLCIAMMMVFAVFTQFSRADSTQNHSGVAFIGILLVLTTILGSYGFLSLCGVKFDHTMMQALPFVVIGLGVDDMFLLLHYYRCVSDKTTTPTEETIAHLLSAAGVSITLTSFCNVFAFASGVITPIPALRTFLTSAAVCVIFNYVSMVLAFPALLAYETDRIKRIYSNTLSTDDGNDNKEDSSNTSPPGKLSLMLSKIPSMQHVIETKYCVLAQTMTFRVVVTSLNLLVFVALIVTLSTSHPLDFGYNIVDLTPRGTYLNKGFTEYEKYFISQINNHDMIITDVDLGEKQTDLWNALKEIRQSPWATKDVETGVPWIKWFLKYASFSGKLIYDDPEQEGVSYDSAHTLPEDFYPTFHSWRNPHVGGLDAITAQTCDDFGYNWGLDSYLPGNTIKLSRTNYALDMSVLKTPSQWLNHIDDFHNIMEKWMGVGKAFPDPSDDYLRMEQFAGLVESFWMEVGIGSAMIVVTAIIVPVSFRGAFVIGATAVVVTIEVASILMLLGVSFSPLVATVLLMAMGISVEFSAHVVVAYENCRDTDTASRIKSSISHTFVPVVEGGISSFLSFSLLGLSEFPYIFKYFFLTFLMVVLVGLVHGLLFLPALMGLVCACDKEKIVSTTNEINIVPAATEPQTEPQEEEVTPVGEKDELPQNPLEISRNREQEPEEP